MTTTFTIPMNLNGQYLFGNDMSGLNFVESSTFSSSCCSHTSFVGSKLVKCDLSSIDLSFSDIQRAIFNKCNFKNANLLYTKISGANFENSNFGSFDPQLVFERDLSNASFSNCHVNPASMDWKDCIIDSINLSHVTLYKPNFQFIKMRSLNDCKFIDAHLSYSVFSELSINSCKFASAFMQYSDFSHTVIKNTDFSNADLCFSDFSNSSVEDCSFNGTNLNFIKISEKTSFKNIQINNIVFKNDEVIKAIQVFSPR